LVLLYSFAIFFPLWYIVPRKIWQPWRDSEGKLKFVRRQNKSNCKVATFEGCLPAFARQGCQILLIQHTKMGKDITNNHKIYQMATK
jgi:hypothetical protein